MVRVRYAPSPTGLLHAGQIRTALFNYLYAKNKRGKFILRIEDTDKERSKPEYENAIYEDLKWLDIEPDESPIHGGEYGPYRQSERGEVYRKYLETLIKNGSAFVCLHTKTELKDDSLHTCYQYRDQTVNENLLGAEKLTTTRSEGVIRFKNPKSPKIGMGSQIVMRGFSDTAFVDVVHTEVRIGAEALGDFSIARNLASPLYNFVVVVDDHEMRISHVIRGEDHIPNTPKQVLLIEALGFQRPKYAHIPLVLGNDRSKLSKRTGAKSIAECRSEGYLPEALLNFLALLGWNPGDEREIFSKEELIKEFSLEKVQKSGAIFDIAKLDWMNGEYIRKKPVKGLAELCIPYLTDFLKFSIPNNQFPISYIEKVVALEQPRLKKLSEIGERTDYFFKEPLYDKELLRWKNMSDEEIAASLDKSIRLLQSLLKSDFNKFNKFKHPALEKLFSNEIGEGDKGRLLWPLRVALTGKKASPGPFEILEILGMEEAKKRLEKARSLFS